MMFNRRRSSHLALAALLATPLAANPTETTPPVPGQYKTEAPALEATWTPARAALGKLLFRDRRLSRDGTVACIDCHLPEKAFTDGKPKSIGVRGQLHRRNSPSLVNSGLTRTQGWDGRTTSLEAHVLGPLVNPVAMDLPIDEALRRLEADRTYTRAFMRAFGRKPDKENLAAALSAYHRTLYSVDAPFDRYVSGHQSALSGAAERGLKLFGGKAMCSSCHAGTNFSDGAYHNIGIGIGGTDIGRGKITGNAAENGAFRTPGLREVALTAPYMHDGSVESLEAVIDYYDRGGNPNPNLDPKMKPLGLTAQEKSDLVEFLKALSGTVMEGNLPVGRRKP
jgi:cytochrome c peroxidase